MELPSIHNHVAQQQLPPFHSPRPRELLPSILARSPPDRATTLPPIQRKESLHRKEKAARPRKFSITQNNRKPKHEKSSSRDHNRRSSIEGRKAFSAEPPSAAAAAAMGKRWEDLIEAATSATEVDSDRDMTPVSRCVILPVGNPLIRDSYPSRRPPTNALRCRHSLLLSPETIITTKHHHLLELLLHLQLPSSVGPLRFLP